MHSRLSDLHIAFLAGTLGQGGAERQLYYIIRTLHLAGATIRLLSLTRGEFWEQPIRDLGVPVVWVGGGKNKVARLAIIIRDLRKSRVSIIQSHHFYTNPYAAIAGRILGIQDVGAIRNDTISEVKANGRFMGRLCLYSPRHMAANSMIGKRNAEQMGVRASRISFLPNVVDFTCFNPSSRQNELPIKILSIGRLEEQKNPQLFLAVLMKLKEASSLPVLGLMGGDGPDRKDLELLAQRYGLLPDGIRFLGNVADPLPLYQSAHIFVLTSDWEGTPNVILEAMACGLPVVATGVGGVPEIIQDHYNGCLVKKGDLVGLQHVLVDLIADEEKRNHLGAMARRSSLEKYDLQRLPEILDQFYQVVL